MPKLKKHESRAGTRGVFRARSAKESPHERKRVAHGEGKEAINNPGLTVPGKFPSSGSRTRHALVDDIGNPAVPEQEDFGGAGDLGTSGAVGGRSSGSAKIGLAQAIPGSGSSGAVVVKAANSVRIVERRLAKCGRHLQAMRRMSKE